MFASTNLAKDVAAITLMKQITEKKFGLNFTEFEMLAKVTLLFLFVDLNRSILFDYFTDTTGSKESSTYASS